MVLCFWCKTDTNLIKQAFVYAMKSISGLYHFTRRRTKKILTSSTMIYLHLAPFEHLSF